MNYLVGRDEEGNREFLITKAAIQEGLDSSISTKNRTANEVIETAKKRALAKTKEQRNAWIHSICQGKKRSGRYQGFESRINTGYGRDILGGTLGEPLGIKIEDFSKNVPNKLKAGGH